MKMRRNKGKVHPSPPPLPPLPPPPLTVASVLQLLPTAILALASLLSIEDQEVLAYMITSSIKSQNPFDENTHKPPLFDCGCFDCYTTYWVRWDSSPNRQLIHQAIEAFEDHLDHSKKPKNRGHRKRDKMGRRKSAGVPMKKSGGSPGMEDSFVVVSVEVDSPMVFSVVEEVAVEEEVLPEMAAVSRSPAANNDKGLARKVLPDVLGFLNSRLWNLWSPKV